MRMKTTPQVVEQAIRIVNRLPWDATTRERKVAAFVVNRALNAARLAWVFGDLAVAREVCASVTPAMAAPWREAALTALAMAEGFAHHTANAVAGRLENLPDPFINGEEAAAKWFLGNVPAWVGAR